MKLGYDLTIEQSQKMIMSHEMLQSIEILQYTATDLEDYVENQIVENPFLEIVSTPGNRNTISADGLKEEYLEKDSEDGFSKFDKLDYCEVDEFRFHHSAGQNNYEEYTPMKENLWDFLKGQLGLCKINDLEEKIGMYLIDEIDSNGYLNSDLSQIAEFFNVEVGIVEDMLYLIQTFEPAGIGARNLGECLSIQICEKGLITSDVSILIEEYLEDVAQNNINKIVKETGIEKNIIEESISIIKSLNPKPGRSYFANNDARIIIPDVQLKMDQESFVVIANPQSYPRIRVNSYYSELSNQAENDANLKSYMNDKYQSASYLIKAIDQRRDTVLKLCKAIVQYQREYFLKGEAYLKPMTLKTIAEMVDIHESTVSRATHGKFMETPSGVLPLKFFFNSGISSSLGDGLSSKSIKFMIREMIDSENQKSPISDQNIADALIERGVEISRRTVAKYRESMGILSSSKRKKY